MSFFTELKRRNVFRVAIAYLAAAWLLTEVAGTLFPMFGYGDAPARIVVILLAIGFPLFLLFSWVFEFTPEGLRLERDVRREGAVLVESHKKLDRTIIVLLALALGYFAFDKFVLEPARVAEIVEETTQQVRSEALVESYGEQSIAVLPFVNMSDDPEQAYFSDGISEELLNLMAQIPDVRVPARTSSFYFKGKDVTIREIAERLDVTHILEGSVRKSGNRVRITAQLIEARSDTHLWSQTYDRELNDIFAIEDEISAAIVGALKARLGLEEDTDAPRTVSATSGTAYDAYLRGRQLIGQRGRQNIAAAAGHLERALRLDENFAPAHAQLGIAMILYSGYTPEERRTAIAHFDRALELEPNLAEAHAGRAMLALHDDDYESAAGHARKALAVNPNYIDALRWLGMALISLGREKEAEAIREQVLVIDPLSVIGRMGHAQTLLYQGRIEEVHQLADQLLADSPWAGYRVHSSAYLWWEGKLAEALYWTLKARDDFYVMTVFQLVGEFAEANRIDHDFSYWSHVAEGRWDEAVQAVQAKLQRDPGNRDYITDAAEVLFLAGRFGEALPLLEHLFALAPHGEDLLNAWFPLGQMMRLALARRMAGDEEGAQAVARIVRQKLGVERGAIGEFKWLRNMAEAMIAAFDHDKDQAIASLRSAVDNGLRIQSYIDDPFFVDLRDDPRFIALRQELVALLGAERERVLQLICFNNPVPDDWQPMPETCEGAVNLGDL